MKEQSNSEVSNPPALVFKWTEGGSNSRHTDFQSVALPTELSVLSFGKPAKRPTNTEELLYSYGCFASLSTRVRAAGALGFGH